MWLIGIQLKKSSLAFDKAREVEKSRQRLKKREYTLKRRFRGHQPLWYHKLPNIYEGVIDASLNTCCKLKFVFLEKRL